ncbi:MAG: hypothetical protein R6V03_04420 [Kiritimatiellia bacterium]
MKTTLYFASAMAIVLSCHVAVSSAQARGGARGERTRTPAENTDDDWGDVIDVGVDIAFSGSYGETVTDENGTFYHVWGYVFYEDKVYPPEYWGVFPLYFFGTEVGVDVAIQNRSSVRKADVLVRNESYCLRTDGGNGAALMTPTDTLVEVDRDGTRTVDASFVAGYVPQAESGLDRFLVKVLGLENGAGSAAVVYNEVELSSGGSAIKFGNPTECLGEDGREETDTFTIQADNAGLTVSVTTKAGTEEAAVILNGNGAAATDSLGFEVRLASVVGSEYTLTVRSASSARALSHVEFDFGADAAITSPTGAEGYDMTRICKDSVVTVREGVFCPPENEGEILDIVNTILAR